MDLVKLFKVLDKYNEEFHSIIDENSMYNLKSLQTFFIKLGDNAYALDCFTIKSKLSRRRSLIVILQERYYQHNCYEKLNINYDVIESEAKRRFKQLNHDKSKFNTPEETHPKNPFKYYGDDKKSFRQYRDALELLAEMPDFYIDGDEAGEDLVKKYNKIKE